MYAINDVKWLVQDLPEVKYIVPQFENEISSRVYYRVMTKPLNKPSIIASQTLETSNIIGDVCLVQL